MRRHTMTRLVVLKNKKGTVSVICSKRNLDVLFLIFAKYITYITSFKYLHRLHTEITLLHICLEEKYTALSRNDASDNLTDLTGFSKFCNFLVKRPKHVSKCSKTITKVMADTETTHVTISRIDIAYRYHRKKNEIIYRGRFATWGK